MTEECIGYLTEAEMSARTWAILGKVGGLDINVAMSVLASAVATCICNSAPSRDAAQQKLVEVGEVLLHAAKRMPEAIETGEIRFFDPVH